LRKMSIREFIHTYCGVCVTSYKQHTIDLMEEIEEHLERQGVAFPTRVGAAHYTVSCALEVYDKELPDYAFLQKVEKAIKSLQVKA